MVESARAIHHLVETVAIKVGNIEGVVALTGIGTVGLAVLVLILATGNVCVEFPQACQRAF